MEYERTGEMNKKKSKKKNNGLPDPSKKYFFGMIDAYNDALKKNLDGREFMTEI